MLQTFWFYGVMRRFKTGCALATAFWLCAFLLPSKCLAQAVEAGFAPGPVREVPGSALLQDQISKDAGGADFLSPDSVRDREALALLLAEYSRRTSEWAPSAEWSWGVLSVNVIHGYPAGRRIWLEPPEVTRWRELLLSQGGRQPEMIRSHPEILVMFTDKDWFFVQPGRIIDGNEAKVIVVFGRQFYRTRHVQGVLRGDIGQDFIAAWQGAERAKNPRAEAEMVQRLIWMAGEMSRLDFLVRRGNLERVLACLDHPDENTSQCADMIWDYELAAARMMLSASQKLEFCPRSDGCDQESQLKIITPPLDMLQFFQPGIATEASIRNYLSFQLPRMYKKQAAHFKKYWSLRGI